MVGLVWIEVDVVEAQPTAVTSVHLQLAVDSTVGQALAMPQVRARFPDSDTRAFGIFGQACAASRRLHDGDRIELYRPLRVDPKDARRARAGASRRGPLAK